MKKELSLVLIGILVLSVYVPVAAPDSEMVNVIFETDDVQALTSTIEGVGGQVTITYINVDYIAAEVPLLSLGDVLASPHCLQMWKDRIQEMPAVPEVSEGDNFTAMEGLDIEGHVTEPYDMQAIEDLPADYYSYMITGAEDIWSETMAGYGTMVAVIDTGIYPYHPCLYPRVIDGICFAPGEDPGSWGDVDNHYHGTVCAGIIGANCGVIWPKTDFWAQAIMRYAPPESWFEYDENNILVPLLGMAPLAEFYAIKVFPKDGSGVPSSVVMQGIDHAIYLRKLYDATGGAEGYPIDVISMSLGGGTGYDGNDPEDRLVDEATKAGIVVSTAAGNSGPAFNTVETPGCANTSISVGAAADAVHSRVGLEIVYGIPGIGGDMFPHDDTQIIYFSSHGPTSDGRLTPDVLACGVYAMSSYPPYYVAIMSGTSSACPVVSGGALLLASWQKMNEGAANPYQIRNAILEGAVPLDLPYPAFAQGHGYLNVVNSLDLLKNGIDDGLHLHSGYSFDKTDLKGGTQTWSTGDLGPGLAYNIAIEVDEDTKQLDICLSNVNIYGPENPWLGDSIEFYVQSSVRTYGIFYYESINVYDDICVTIPNPHPGTVRIVIEGDWTNWSPVSCDVSVTETEGKENPGGHKETIGNDDWHVYYIDVPEGLGAVIFELWWMHDWSKWPTYDLDMYVIDPYGSVFVNGATFFSPEHEVFYDPIPGTYIVLIYGYEIYHGRDPYQLRIFYIE